MRGVGAEEQCFDSSWQTIPVCGDSTRSVEELLGFAGASSELSSLPTLLVSMSSAGSRHMGLPFECPLPLGGVLARL